MKCFVMCGENTGKDSNPCLTRLEGGFRVTDWYKTIMCRDNRGPSSDKKMVVILSGRDNKTCYFEKLGEKSKQIGTKAIPEEKVLHLRIPGYRTIIPLGTRKKKQRQARTKQGQSACPCFVRDCPWFVPAVSHFFFPGPFEHNWYVAQDFTILFHLVVI